MDAIGFLIALVVFAIIGFYILVNPLAVVRMFENMAAKSNDLVAERSRSTFDPSRRTHNARTLRVVGGLWLLIIAFIAALLWLNR